MKMKILNFEQKGPKKRPKKRPKKGPKSIDIFEFVTTVDAGDVN
jgi:hypothetical protein